MRVIIAMVLSQTATGPIGMHVFESMKQNDRDSRSLTGVTNEQAQLEWAAPLRRPPTDSLTRLCRAAADLFWSPLGPLRGRGGATGWGTS